MVKTDKQQTTIAKHNEQNLIDLRKGIKTEISNDIFNDYGRDFRVNLQVDENSPIGGAIFLSSNQQTSCSISFT